jgi:hypothetical protein
VGFGPLGVVFLVRAVDLEGPVEQRVPAAGEQPQQGLVAPEELVDPPELELLAVGQRWRRVVVGQGGDGDVDDVPRRKEARVAEEIAEEVRDAPLARLKDRRVLDGVIRTPFAFRVVLEPDGGSAGATRSALTRTRTSIDATDFSAFIQAQAASVKGGR